MEHIVAAVEFEHSSGKLLPLLEELASTLRSKLWLIHVCAPEPDFVGYEGGPGYVRDHAARTLREEHQQAQQIAADLREKGLTAKALTIQGPTAEKILDECTRLRADLLVIGRHRHGPFHGLIHPDVVRELVRDSHCPVLVVPLD